MSKDGQMWDSFSNYPLLNMYNVFSGSGGHSLKYEKSNPDEDHFNYIPIIECVASYKHVSQIEIPSPSPRKSSYLDNNIGSLFF